ncbi:MAG: hypothetical protein ACPGUD_00370 [Parashewanella sp.]
MALAALSTRVLPVSFRAISTSSTAISQMAELRQHLTLKGTERENLWFLKQDAEIIKASKLKNFYSELNLRAHDPIKEKDPYLYHVTLLNFLGSR